MVELAETHHTAAVHRAVALGVRAQENTARANALLTESSSVHDRCRLTVWRSIQLRHAARCTRHQHLGPIFASDEERSLHCHGGWVLVVDDHEAVRETTAEVLATAGFNVRTAHGEDAVRLLTEDDICVLLLDVGIEHEGLAILDTVTTLPPVILMSGGTLDPEDPRASAFLSKPIPIYRLVEEVAHQAAKAIKPTVEHQLADPQTTRSRADTWSGFMACSCGWFTEVVGQPCRHAAAIILRTTWSNHSSESSSGAGSRNGFVILEAR